MLWHELPICYEMKLIADMQRPTTKTQKYKCRYTRFVMTELRRESYAARITTPKIEYVLER